MVILPAAKPVAAYRVHVNEHVRFFLDRFQTGYRRAVVEGWLTRSGRYLPMILEVFRQKGPPEDLVVTVMIESGFNPVAVSHAGAKGLWQFMAPTARLYGLRVDGWLDERLDPRSPRWPPPTTCVTSTPSSGRGIWPRPPTTRATGNPAGDRSHRLARLLGAPQEPASARRDQELRAGDHAATLIGRQPERYGFSVVPEEPLQYEQVMVPKGSRLVRLAALSGLTLQDLES